MRAVGLFFVLLVSTAAWAETVSDLWLRGYAVLPEPARVELEQGSFAVDSGWKLSLSDGVAEDDAAVESLRGVWTEEVGGGLLRTEGGEGPAVELRVEAGAVGVEAREEIARQAYRLELRPDRIRIVGNAPQGLFYGVQTLIQLVRSSGRTPPRLPRGVIEDWPDLELREIHWDSKHHQDRMETLKRYLRQSAEYKINAVGWEIEDKFAYPSHPIIGAPGAFTTDEIQELVVYARRLYIEIIPLLQGPSHMAYVLKHEIFADLREDETNNYMICPTRASSYRLIFDMYGDMLKATAGGRFFHVATDEAYYLGAGGKDCDCDELARRVGASGVFVEFMKRTGGYLEERGREVMFWGESPLEIRDIPKLSPTLIDAVAGSDREEIAAEKAHGMRLMIYVSTQGVDKLFPGYYLPRYPRHGPDGRLRGLQKDVSSSPAWEADVLGTFTAAWDDAGLHNETFWLGWVAGSSWGWRRGSPRAEELAGRFLKSFYGPAAHSMGEVYLLTDQAANFWENSWDRVPAKRGPSYKKYTHWDHTLSLPHLPDPVNLNPRAYWKDKYGDILERAERERRATTRLIALLEENLGKARRNRYNLEVLLSIAFYTRHNLDLFRALGGIEDALERAAYQHRLLRFENAAAELDRALLIAERITAEREQAYRELRHTWEKSRFPKGVSQGGRDFVHRMDDTKDHWADRTADLSYLVARERDLNLEGWRAKLAGIRDRYRKAHPRDLRYAPDELEYQPIEP